MELTGICGEKVRRCHTYGFAGGRYGLDTEMLGDFYVAECKMLVIELLVDLVIDFGGHFFYFLIVINELQGMIRCQLSC